ncbi:MAG: MgtC/SapB family protein [Candidatus Fermentibacteraceae bacterium]|nr:MgtC/SapB family protein [Candidatus Fermentibacteraceae bacterium]MBN2608939.1 MgtC/SapB family protein [Candidatus Fermentibacteraceae bacterium]
MTFEDSLFRLLVAALLGSLIGLEREYHGRPAGLRTHMLVCIGATMITISGLIIAQKFSQGGTSPGAEISRIVAGVVTGIGFLGAGAIVRTSDFVRGLTTAACIWFVAALGVVIGLGEFMLGVSGTGVALLILITLPFLEYRLSDLKYRDVLILGENSEPEMLVDKCSSIFSDHMVHIHDIDIEIDRDGSSISLLFHLRIRKLDDKMELLNQLSEVQGVISVQWQRSAGRI